MSEPRKRSKREYYIDILTAEIERAKAAREDRVCLNMTKAAAAELIGILGPRGTFECFHCGQNTAVWNADFSFDEYGMEDDGIVHNLTCINCGAEIEYYIRTGDREDER